MKYRVKLDELAQILLQKETMTVEEFLVTFEGEKAKEREEKKIEEQLDPPAEPEEAVGEDAQPRDADA